MLHFTHYEPFPCPGYNPENDMAGLRHSVNFHSPNFLGIPHYDISCQLVKSNIALNMESVFFLFSFGMKYHLCGSWLMKGGGQYGLLR